LIEGWRFLRNEAGSCSSRPFQSGVNRMYYFWRKTELGKISLSRDGFVRYISAFLREPFTCHHVTLSPADSTLFLGIGCPEDSSPLDHRVVQERVVEAIRQLGLSTRITWIEQENVSVRSLISGVLVNRPILWGVVGFAIAALFIMGLKWFLLAGIMGALCFGVSRALLSERGRELIRKIHKWIGR